MSSRKMISPIEHMKHIIQHIKHTAHIFFYGEKDFPTKMFKLHLIDTIIGTYYTYVARKRYLSTQRLT